jgi:hypothetical protein
MIELAHSLEIRARHNYRLAVAGSSNHQRERRDHAASGENGFHLG